VISLWSMKKPARKDQVADKATVLTDSKLRHVIGGHIGGPQAQQHENQVFTTR
jgi:hypothetical protein